ncbi:hypothetical protein [Psychrobacillus psychrodurans]|uniref:hypothetical protein n=1 Tax=Psychrobacillus psychrodurans TaxID=126157 RepID=UPI0008EC54EB|nr:hypothetical protein [Psychrobacillus psychrodurans]MCZ8540424.1 hypothetical protein [Psychrobacillus psychrodurans]SFM58496.1 hypothetical protein SAMN05421832_10410 [Psychrobacillus psychrodurans]
MDDKQLEERLNLLKSSYDRLPSSLDTDEILQKIENENNIAPVEKKSKGSKWQRITVWAVSIASVFVIGILGTTFLNDSNDVTTSDQENSEDDIKNLEKKYKEERLKRQQMLQMDEVEFASIEFVQYADSIFSAQISPGTLEGKNDNIPIKEGYKNALEGLKLPSEMVEDTISKGKLNAVQSISFIGDFIAKTEHLINFYEYLLYEQGADIKIAEHDGRLSEHVLIANRYNMPEEIQNMIEVLPKQGLKLAVNKEGTAFQIVPDWAMFTRDLFTVLDENESRYLSLYSSIPGYGIVNLLDEQDFSVLGYYLAEIEFTLLNSTEDSVMHARFENYYFDLAEMILFPSDINEMFNENNVLNMDTRIAWESLVNIPGVSPIASLMKPVVISMNASNWKYNETYKLLDIEQLRDYYYMALEDALETTKLDWFALLPDGEEMSLESNEASNRLLDLYERFNENFDFSVLHGVGPMDITLIYHYADSENNHEVMWELMSSTFKSENSKQDFIENPTLQNIIRESSKNLYFNKDYLIQNNKYLTTYIGQEKGDQVSYDLVLRLDSDDIWRIQGVEDSISKGTLVDDEFVQRVHALYKAFAKTYDQAILKEATPEEVVGLFYYSAQLKDYDTQYELYIKDDTRLQIPKDEYMSGEHQNIVDIRLEFTEIKFALLSEGYGVVTLTKHPDPRKSDDNPIISFQLIQTENGWRPPFMPIQ